MYQIFADGELVYDESSNDLGKKITSATLTLEDNSAGSLDITLPPTNDAYDAINRMRTHIVVKRDNVKIWGGRALSESTDFYKNKTIFCEGELAYLNDTYQPLQEYNDMTVRQFIEALLMVHNDKCNGDDFDPSQHMDKRIYVGTVTIYDDFNIESRYTNYESTFDILAGMIETYGGHMRIRTATVNGAEKLYLDYLKDYPNTNSQTIEFAKNLLDYSKNYDLSNLCTVLLPLGAKKESGGSGVVGDEITVHWNKNSFLTSDGRIRYGKNFHVTNYLSVEKESTWIEYNSSTGAVTDETSANTLKVTLEQVGGFAEYCFYTGGKQPIIESIRTASAGSSTGVERVYNSSLTIPDNAKYVRFGYYLDTKTAAKFRAIFTTKHATFEWTHDTVVNGDLQTNSDRVISTETGNLMVPVPDNYVVSNPIYVKTDQIYYITARQDNGYGMYCAYLADGTASTSVSTAGTGLGFTDWEQYKIESLPAATKYFIIGAKTGVGLNPKLHSDLKAGLDSYIPPDEYVTIESVNDNSLYLKNESLIARYGWIEKQVNFDDAMNPEDLLTVATKYLNNSQFGEMVLQVNAFDMHLVNSSVEAINILDKVRCVSTPHGLSATLPVTKLEIPLLTPQESTFTLGTEDTEIKSLTGANAQSDLEIFARLAEQRSPSSVLNSAVANATSLINQRTNGYVVVEPNELLIMDTPSKDTCSRLWRMNVNGIGYSNEGYNGPFGLAFTMDGSIVADRITTGFMHADRIRGGTLTLGGYDNVNGEFYMKNDKGKNFVKMTKDGCQIIGSITQALQWNVHSSYDSTSGLVSTPKFGVVEYSQGAICGYTANVQAEVEKTSTVNNANWWKSYTFSFDDIKSRSLKTAIYMMRSPLKFNTVNGKELFGITAYSADYFSLWLGSSVGTKNKNAPHIELNNDKGPNSICFGSSTGSSFTGFYYDSDTTPYLFTSGTKDSTSDASMTDGRNFYEQTLVIRNDTGPSQSSYSEHNVFGFGGIYIYSNGYPVSIRGSEIHIGKGSQELTAISGTFNVITEIRARSDGGVDCDRRQITITNGFVTSAPVDSSSSGGSGGSSSGGGTFVSG